MFSVSLVSLIGIVVLASILFFLLGLSVRAKQLKKVKQEMAALEKELMEAYAECLRQLAS